MPNILRNASGDLIAKRTLQRNPTYLNVSKNILARQSIFRNVDCNIEHTLKKAPSILSDQQIKQSSIYERLVLRIQKAKQRQQQQKIQHQRRMKLLEQEIMATKQSIRQDKLDIWEVRNELMGLQEVFESQIEEYEELYHILQDQMQQNGQHQFMDSEQSYDQGETFVYNQNQQSQRSHYQDGDSSNQVPNSQQRDSYSKPTCSIKLMITERSIDTPDVSNIHTNSGRQMPFSDNIPQNYTHNFMSQQSEQENHYSRILSFKKSENVFTNNI